MSNEENVWESRYQAGTIGWDRGSASTNLSFWLDEGLLKSCRILIPGCGNGYEVITLVKLGFDVVAIDIAPTAIQNLQSLLDEEGLKAELELGDFFTWNPEEKFDAVFEQTSLCALPPELWEQYENQLYKWLKPEGTLFAAFMQTGQDGGPPYHCELVDMNLLLPKDKWSWSDEYSMQQKEKGKNELLYILKKI